MGALGLCRYKNGYVYIISPRATLEETTAETSSLPTNATSTTNATSKTSVAKKVYHGTNNLPLDESSGQVEAIVALTAVDLFDGSPPALHVDDEHDPPPPLIFSSPRLLLLLLLHQTHQVLLALALGGLLMVS